MSPMVRRREKIVKTRAEWRRQSQVKKIRIVMTAILIILCLSVAAAALLAWSQVRRIFQPPASAAPSSRQASPAGEDLPVYDNSFSLMLVNYSKPLESGYRPDLADCGGVKADSRIVPALRKMMDGAKAAGCPMTLSGGYVDADTQNKLYEAEVERLMNQEHLSRVRAENQAQNTVGKGGYNENQTGLAVTFSDGEDKSDFSSTRQYHWLSENSVYYGFILRFPKDRESVTGMSFNPAHFRYVGTENAVKMREFSMCMEEYIAYLGQRSGG